jgi:hypothetical protein
MTSPTPELAGMVRVGSFGSFFQRFGELIAGSNGMTLYFIHSRRWRENHDATIKSFLRREGTTLDVFLPDLENHELMFSIARHFDDGALIAGLVVDAYRYFARLAREYGRPKDVWLFNRYPAYSFYRFDERAVMAFYSNAAAKKELPAFEVENGSPLGSFLTADIEDLKKESRRRAPTDLDAVIRQAPAPPAWDELDSWSE